MCVEFGLAECACTERYIRISRRRSYIFVLHSVMALSQFNLFPLANRMTMTYINNCCALLELYYSHRGMHRRHDSKLLALLMRIKRDSERTSPNERRDECNEKISNPVTTISAARTSTQNKFSFIINIPLA